MRYDDAQDLFQRGDPVEDLRQTVVSQRPMRADARRNRQRVFDAALTSTTCALRVSDGVIEELRLAVGATTPRPTLCATSTQGLRGQPLDAFDPVLVADEAAIEVLGPESSRDSRHGRHPGRRAKG